jgi:ABC-2 type transport system ATP-binding protein
MTGGYLLNYFARFKPSKPARLKTELVERFDLDLARKVGEYSRGNRQKLAIILALMHDPKLLILDEPTLALDPLMQREFYKVLQEFRDRGATVFLSSHILPEVEKICDRVGIIRDGRLIAVESVEALVKKKIYHIEASFADEVKASQLKIPGVVQVDQENHIFHLTFKGDLNRLLSSLNQYQILDLTINHARLEEIFFEFYQ